MMKIKWRFIALGLVSVLAVVLTTATATASKVNPCGAADGVAYKNYALSGSALMKVSDAGECQMVADSNQVLNTSLSSLSDEETAKQLMLARYRQQVEAKGGAKPYEAAWAEHLKTLHVGTESYIRPESVWALEQLGVAIPPGVIQVGGSTELRRAVTPRQ